MEGARKGYSILAVGEAFINFFNHICNKQMKDLPWGRQRPRDFDEIVSTVKRVDALKNHIFILPAIF